MLKLTQKLSSILLLCLALGCSENTSHKTSTLYFKMPENLQQKTGQIGSFATKACFAVNITAQDISSQASTACDTSYGDFAGLVPAGGTIALDTKMGSNRKIELYYVISDSGCNIFNKSSGLGQTFGSNNVHLISTKNNVNFDKPQVSVEMNIQWPNELNSLASVLSAPASCLKADINVNLMAIKEASVIQGAGRGTTANGSIIQIKILDQNLNMNPPTNLSGRILPNRLGEEL